MMFDRLLIALRIKKSAQKLDSFSRSKVTRVRQLAPGNRFTKSSEPQRSYAASAADTNSGLMNVVLLGSLLNSGSKYESSPCFTPEPFRSGGWDATAPSPSCDGGSSCSDATEP